MKKSIVGLAAVLVFGVSGLTLAGDSFLLGDGGNRDETVRVMDGNGNVDYYSVQQENGSVSVRNNSTGDVSLGSWDGESGHLIDMNSGDIRFIRRDRR